MPRIRSVWLFTLLRLLLLTAQVHQQVSAANYPDSPDSTPPAQWSSMSDTFTRHCSPFGVSIFAQGWPEDKFIHACNILAQMLDNDQDGCADDPKVVEKIRYRQAGMAMFESESSLDQYAQFISRSFAWQGLWADETELSCSGADETGECRDAAIEEILHVVSDNGIGEAYPEKFSDCGERNLNNLSDMMKQMDIARGGHFESVPTTYPSDTIFHYTDKTCDYRCMGTEFFYWALTSLTKGQNARKEGNMLEWEASTPWQLREKLPGIYDLLTTGNSMKLLSKNGVLPGSGGAGAQFTYKPSSQTCPSGCALDGSGCGDLGNKNQAPSRCEPGCEDNPSFRKVFKNNQQEIKSKGCNWFAKGNSAKRCRKKDVIENCPVSCGVCGKNGEEVCEQMNLKKQSKCEAVSCCNWNKGKCWSSVDDGICYPEPVNFIYD